MSESQTPRVDAAMKVIGELAVRWAKGEIYNEEFAVGAPAALRDIKYLETELTATRARLAELEGFTTWLFDNAEMLYWPGNHECPVENKPLAKNNARMAMEMYFIKKFPAYKEGKK